ncbi:MAG: hypothetical protein ACRDY7_13880, partial [Acidimicrobiia bacterium]
EHTVHFDADPMGGDGDDASYYGVMEAYGALVGGDEDGADTRGSRPADPGEQPGSYARGHLVSGGVMVGWHEDGDDLDAMRAHERALGKRMAVVRLYEQWGPPGTKVDEAVAEGRLAVVSHKPPPEIGWVRIAAGLEDAMIHALAEAYRAYGRDVVFVFHHEPHDDAIDLNQEGAYGLSGNFVAAFRRIHDVFVADGAHVSAGGNVSFGYSATTPWVLEGDPAGVGDDLYPGEGYVDVLAHDRYNWFSCRDDAWEEFSANWAPIVAVAARQRKPLIIGEFGSAPGGGRRNEWFAKAAAWMKSDPDARRWLIGFAYYHSHHDTCRWDFMNQGDDGRRGWAQAFGDDPYFLGSPFPLARPEPVAPGLPVLVPLPLPLPDAVLPEPPMSPSRFAVPETQKRDQKTSG